MSTDGVAKEGRPKFNPRPGRGLNTGPSGWAWLVVGDLTNCANLAHKHFFNTFVSSQITLLLAWISFFVFKDKTSPENYKDWKELFFLIVHFTGCLAMLLFFFVFLTGLEKKLGTSRCWHLFVSIRAICNWEFPIRYALRTMVLTTCRRTVYFLHR